MKQINKAFTTISVTTLLVLVVATGCKKESDFLDAVPRSDLAVPSTLRDLELMSQNANSSFNTSDPTFPVICGEKYFLADTYYSASVSLQQQSGYIWAKNMNFNQAYSLLDWNFPFKSILTANTILDQLKQIKYDAIADGPRANAIKGMALFRRSWAFFNLAIEFCMPYDSANAENQLGIPLRLSTDMETVSVRANLKDSYNQIINDLKEAISLLPPTSVNITVPNNISAKGLLARIFLSVGDYKDAYEYSNGFLQQFSTVTDYNTLTPKSGSIHTTFISEDVFHTGMISTGLVFGGSTQMQVDSTFYASYDGNDLRQTLFFNISGGRRYFRGSYDMSRSILYDGIATDEMLLTRAECYARQGNFTAALNDLNALLKYRYKPGTYQNYTTANTPDVLSFILKEREKELYMRGLRWLDLRRLNKETGRAVTLTRTVNGITYTLPPNDPRYAIQIPDQEILFSGIQQNPR